MSDRIEHLKSYMEKALEAFQRELSSVRTGRAHGAILDGIKVDLYGALSPLSTVGTISVPEARTLSIQVWDKSAVKAVEKAIIESDLDMNPIVDGQMIRIHMPDLSEERRRDLVKLAAKYAEQSKVSMRSVRRDGMDALKKMEKDGILSADEAHRESHDIQKLTDAYVGKIDDIYKNKEQDIMSL